MEMTQSGHGLQWGREPFRCRTPRFSPTARSGEADAQGARAGPMEAEEAEAGASPLDRPRHAAPSGMVSLQPGSPTRFPLVPGV